MSSGGDQSSGPGGRERRRYARIATRRSVVFHDDTGVHPPFEGVLLDRSVAGLKIETRRPCATGSRIEIEIRSAEPSGSAVSLLEGTVAYVTRLSNGASAMGVSLEPRTGGGVMGSFLSDASTESIRVVTGEPSEIWSIGETVDTAKPAPKAVAPEPEPARYRKTVAALVIAIVLLLLFLVAQQAAELDSPVPGPRVSARIGGAGPDAAPPHAELPTSAERLAAAEPLTRVSDTTPAALMSRAEAALDAGLGSAADRIFEHLESRDDLEPVQRVISLLGHARSAGAAGERDRALGLVREALVVPGEVPEVWFDEARSLDRRLAGEALSDSFVEPMEHVLDLDDADEDAPTGNSGGEALRVDVDTGDYTLSVMRGDAVLDVFPIGLGRDGATPEGAFTIANKISNPDWYNRGASVPAGDPDNPLGAQWMGLGENGVATSFGIHGSADPRAIGQPFSRGCVRMRPADAEALFRLAPIGTPVTIHP